MALQIQVLYRLFIPQSSRGFVIGEVLNKPANDYDRDSTWMSAFTVLILSQLRVSAIYERSYTQQATQQYSLPSVCNSSGNGLHLLTSERKRHDFPGSSTEVSFVVVQTHLNASSQ